MPRSLSKRLQAVSHTIHTYVRTPGLFEEFAQKKRMIFCNGTSHHVEFAEEIINCRGRVEKTSRRIKDCVRLLDKNIRVKRRHVNLLQRFVRVLDR